MLNGIAILVTACGMGIAASYGLNRRVFARRYERHHAKSLPRTTSLVIVLLLWTDGALLMGLVAALAQSWILVVFAWLVVNYVSTVIYIIRKRRSGLLDRR